MKTLTKAEWKKKHRDKKSTINGQKYVPAYNDKTGGTELIPVEVK